MDLAGPAGQHQGRGIELGDDRGAVDPVAGTDELQSLLAPPPEAPFATRRVSRRVNDVRNNDAALLDDAPPPPQLLHLF